MIKGTSVKCGCIISCIVYILAFILFDPFYYHGFIPFHIKFFKIRNNFFLLQNLEIRLWTGRALHMLISRIKEVRSLNNSSYCLHLSQVFPYKIEVRISISCSMKQKCPYIKKFLKSEIWGATFWVVDTIKYSGEVILRKMALGNGGNYCRPWRMFLAKVTNSKLIISLKF